jgi:uncharacterized membrane protein YfcA
LSQVIQVPIAVAATAGNLLYGTVNVVLAGILAVSLTVGSWYGAKFAHSVSRERLRRIVSIVLVMVGVFILCGVAWRFVQ